MSRLLSRRLFAAVTIAAVPLIASMQPSATAAAAQPSDPRTILDRVFSVAQAERGEQRFKQSCSSCHRADEFAGSAFSERWEAQTLGDLFAYISDSMPADDPGALKPEEYANVIAFFLGQNGYPVGTDDLPADAAVLKQIGIVANPK